MYTTPTRHRAASREVAAKPPTRLSARSRIAAIVSSMQKMGAATAKIRTLRTSEALERAHSPVPPPNDGGADNSVARMFGHNTFTMSRRQSGVLRETTYREDYSDADDVSRFAHRLNDISVAITSMSQIALLTPKAFLPTEGGKHLLPTPGLNDFISPHTKKADVVPEPNERRLGIMALESRKTLPAAESQATYLVSLVASLESKARSFGSSAEGRRRPKWPPTQIVNTLGARLRSLNDAVKERMSPLLAAAGNDSSLLGAHRTSAIGAMGNRNFGLADALNRNGRSDGDGIAKSLGAVDFLSGRLDRYGSPHLLALALPQTNSRAAEILRLEERWSAFRPLTPAHAPDLPSAAVRSQAGSSELKPSITLNFSPTVVVQGDAGVGNTGDAVMQAIRRHSHELVHIINREMEARKRTLF